MLVTGGKDVDYRELLDKFERNLKDNVEAVFQDITTQFDQMCQFRDEDDEAAVAAKAQLQLNLATAQAYLDKEMDEGYKALKNKFR